MIETAFTINLDIIDTPGGDVMHAMKVSSEGYVGFGEAYFSKINYGNIKGWKRHNRMTLNLIVPVGKIKFVLYDDRQACEPTFQEFILSTDNYVKLTIPPKIWVGFQGLCKSGSMLLNIADLEHSKIEVDVLALDDINYNWDQIK